MGLPVWWPRRVETLGARCTRASPGQLVTVTKVSRAHPLPKVPSWVVPLPTHRCCSRQPRVARWLWAEGICNPYQVDFPQCKFGFNRSMDEDAIADILKNNKKRQKVWKRRRRTCADWHWAPGCSAGLAQASAENPVSGLIRTNRGFKHRKNYETDQSLNCRECPFKKVGRLSK